MPEQVQMTMAVSTAAYDLKFYFFSFSEIFGMQIYEFFSCLVLWLFR